MPTDVIFGENATSTKFTFTVVDDSEDDDGESVRLTFGEMPSDVSATSPNSATFNITDNDDPVVRVSFEQATYTVNEGGSVSIKITLDAQPERTLEIPIQAFSEGSTTQADFSIPSSVTFNSSDTEKTLRFSAIEDMMDDDGDYVTVSFGSPLPDLVLPVTPNRTEVYITDNDGAGVTINPRVLSLSEGNTKGRDYTVKLDSQPMDDVTVSISKDIDDSAVTLSTTTLIFSTSTWSTAQTVTVTAPEDPDAEDETGAITHELSSSDQKYTSTKIPSETLKVSVSVNDPDNAGVTIEPRRLEITEDDPNAETYTVKLNTQPSADVEIVIGKPNDDGDRLTVTPGTLFFNSVNWENIQTVEVTARDDNDPNDETITLTHTLTGATEYDGFDAGNVSVRIDDDDTAGVKITPQDLEVDEDDSNTYDIVLQTQPTQDVVVTVSESGDTGDDITLDTTTLTFSTSTWEFPQTVTITAVADADAVDETVTLSHSVSGYGPVTSADSVTVTINDPDEAGAELSTSTLELQEGNDNWEKYEVKLKSMPSRDVTITISDDGNLEIMKRSLHFTPDNWNSYQPVMVTPPQDDDADMDTSTISHAFSARLCTFKLHRLAIL